MTSALTADVVARSAYARGPRAAGVVHVCGASLRARCHGRHARRYVLVQLGDVVTAKTVATLRRLGVTCTRCLRTRKLPRKASAMRRPT